MTTIIITECTNPYGKYWEFKDKKSGQIVAEVDKKREREFGPGPLYFVYTMRDGFAYETARHSKKDMALEFAKQAIRNQFTGDQIDFKWNAMRIKERWA